MKCPYCDEDMDIPIGPIVILRAGVEILRSKKMCLGCMAAGIEEAKKFGCKPALKPGGTPCQN